MKITAFDPEHPYRLGTGTTLGSSAGGDLSGSLPSPTVVGIRGVAVSSNLPTAVGQVLTTSQVSPPQAVWATPSNTASASNHPAWTYVVAASDTPATLRAIADYLCDGTADQTEINTAITAAAASGVSDSILLLPGTYTITGAIDFTGYTGATGRLVFDARAAVINAGANLTTMIDLAPGAGGQILAKLDVQLGQLNGMKGTYTVTQAIHLRRFSDNRLWVQDIYNVSGDGIRASQSGVADFGCFNNQIEVIRLNEIAGIGIYADGDSSVYGFQGNTVITHQIAYNGNGIIMGDSTNDTASWNTFICGPIEHQTAYGVYDRGGANTWHIGNMNNNGTGGIGCPTGMTRRSTFVTVLDGDAIDAAVLAQHYVLDTGRFRGTLDVAEGATPATPPSGFGRLYFKTDGKAYALNDGGTEYDLTSSGSAASSVTSETTLGISAAVGIATAYARSDHTHGSPSTTTIRAAGFVGELLISDTPAGTPLVFADLLQNEAQADLVYADL